MSLHFGCSSEKFTPVIQRIGIIDAFDIGNEGNSTDIRVRFVVVDGSGVAEYRILVIPVEKADLFDEKEANQLTQASYHHFPGNDEDLQSTKLSSISDTDGNPIRNAEEYVIRIWMTGDGISQLSRSSSNVLVLKDQGIYDGYYSGNLCCPFIVPQPIRPDLIIEMDISGVGDQYEGIMTIQFDAGNNPNIPPLFADVGLYLEGSRVTSLALSNFMGEDADFMDTFLSEMENCDGLIPVGSGAVMDDLDLEVVFDVCSDPEFVLQLTRLTESD